MINLDTLEDEFTIELVEALDDFHRYCYDLMIDPMIDEAEKEAVRSIMAEYLSKVYPILKSFETRMVH